MSAKIEKRAIIIYGSVVQALEKFPPEKRGKLARQIIRHGISGETGELSAEERIVLKPIFDGINAEKRRYRNVQSLQNMIDTTIKRAISIPPVTKENHERLPIDNFIKILKRMVSDCKKHDRSPEYVKAEVEKLVKSTPKISELLK